MVALPPTVNVEAGHLIEDAERGCHINYYFVYVLTIHLFDFLMMYSSYMLTWDYSLGLWVYFWEEGYGTPVLNPVAEQIMYGIYFIVIPVFYQFFLEDSLDL